MGMMGYRDYIRFRVYTVGFRSYIGTKRHIETLFCGLL